MLILSVRRRPCINTDTNILKEKDCRHVPIVAIGGIDKNNAGWVIKAGADSVVAVSAVVCSDNIYGEVSDFIRVIKENKAR